MKKKLFEGVLIYNNENKRYYIKYNDKSYDDDVLTCGSGLEIFIIDKWFSVSIEYNTDYYVVEIPNLKLTAGLKVGRYKNVYD